MGNYASQSGMEAIYGAKNVATWSNPDSSSTTPNAPYIQSAVDWANGFIDQRFASSKYVVPLVNLSAGDAAVLAEWANTLAGYKLYRARGQKDDKVGNQLKASYEEAILGINSIVCGYRAFSASLA